MDNSLNQVRLYVNFRGQDHRHSQKGAWGLAPPKGSGKNLHNHFSRAKGSIIYVKVLCLVIVNVNVTKYMPQKCQI